MAIKLVTNVRNALIVILAMACVGYLAYAWSYQRGIDNLRHEADVRLSIVRAVLQGPADKYRYLPGMIAEHPSTIGTLLGKSDPAVINAGNLFLQQLNTETELDVIYLMDASGLTVASSNWQEKTSFLGQNYSFRPYFQDAVRDGAGKFYAVGTISLIPGYYLSSVVEKDGVVLGVIVIKIAMDNLDNLNRAQERSLSEVTVTDENGIAFLSTVDDWKYRPLATLSEEAEKKVRKTRQYERVLKTPLPATIETSFGPNERIVNVIQSDDRPNDRHQIQYLALSGQLPGSLWMVNVFVPMKPINLVAIRVAMLAVAMFGFLILALMYLLETRSRIDERERAGRALQAAHDALEHKNNELETLSEEMRIVSITDSLTGAFNRRYFLDVVGKLADNIQNADCVLSIMMIDVDYFKRINDVYGHPTGDKVLQLLTFACKDILRTEDVFARFGGEEFIMAFPDTDEDAAMQIAERLRTNIMAHPFEVNGQILALTVSCGISRYQFTETTMDETIKRADEALYEAKSNGRNQVVVRV
jgi:two-component system C4-dicarboxylate transport sensor histidine kinase DctB